MDDEMYEKILNAGAELYQCLDSVLKNHGLDENYAPSVAAVVVAGIIRGEVIDLRTMVDATASCLPLWEKDASSGTLLGVRFDPSHRRRN